MKHRLGVLAIAAAIAVCLAAPASAGLDPEVRTFSSGDKAELVKTIPITRARGARPKVVMRIDAGKIGPVEAGEQVPGRRRGRGDDLPGRPDRQRHLRRQVLSVRPARRGQARARAQLELRQGRGDRQRAGAGVLAAPPQPKPPLRARPALSPLGRRRGLRRVPRQPRDDRVEVGAGPRRPPARDRRPRIGRIDRAGQGPPQPRPGP